MSDSPLTLLMAIHCHQPVGNFDFVFEEAFKSAYDPFLRVLERHPQVRLSLHYSGSLLDWLMAHQPKFLDRVRVLVRRGQVELLASGYYEPILPLLPEADRQGQLKQMRAALRKRFGVTPSGLWLTERVWEPELPKTLASAGIRYTMVDTNQFATAKAWLPSSLQRQDEGFWDLLGCYTTEYGGSSMCVFPASKRLRYWMPFQPVERTINFLKQLRPEEPTAITFADDGEKFGMWPNTFRWVYEEAWLDRFFTALEGAQDWLQTSTFQDYLDTIGPQGHVYLPCGSYEEMLEWSGGHFRNFFTKYPEANAMYQKMLRVSQQLQDVERSTRNAPQLSHARQELYAGQCNCAYWHGVFGGLYLTHLRRAVYQHLITAEADAAKLHGPRVSVSSCDTDGDGRLEVMLRTPTVSMVVDPDEGGAITEWNLLGPRVNLVDTLSRRPEPYHEKLRARAAMATVTTGEAPPSIHNLLGVKEEHLEAYLLYDDHRRSAFLDYALQRLPSLHEVTRSTWGEQRLWSGMPYQRRVPAGKARGLTRSVRVILTRELPDGRIVKTVEVDARRPIVECRYRLEGTVIPVLGLEFNVSLRDPRYLRDAQEYTNLTHFTMEEAQAGIRVTVQLDPPATVMHFPIETVSESEQGMERTYQGLCVMCFWVPQAGRRAGRWTSTLRWTTESLD